MFAGVMMIMAGGFQSLAGMAALFKDDFYVTTPNYLLEFDTTSWGWIHLLMGLLVLFAGFAVLQRQGVGAHDRRHPGRPQRPGELRLHPLLPVLVDDRSSRWTSSSSGR